MSWDSRDREGPREVSFHSAFWGCSMHTQSSCWSTTALSGLPEELNPQTPGHPSSWRGREDRQRQEVQRDRDPRKQNEEQSPRNAEPWNPMRESYWHIKPRANRDPVFTSTLRIPGPVATSCWSPQASLFCRIKPPDQTSLLSTRHNTP